MSGVLADIGIGPINIPTPGDVVTALKNAVLDVADAVFDKIIEWIAGLLADAVTKVTEALVTLLSAIKPTLTPGGAIEDAGSIQQSVLGLAASLVALFFVFRIIHGLITGQAGQNLRATLVDLPMVIVGTLFFGFLCYTLLTIVDEFSDPLITQYAETLSTTVGELYSQDGIVQGGVFVIIFALLYIVAAVFLCFELFVRSSLIYLVVMFAPLAIATRVWGPTRSYARRATEVAVALIFSKLAIAVTLATGASLMAGADESGGNVAMIQGSAILLLAAFMPFGLMRVIPMMEGAVAAEGVARTMGVKAAGGAVMAGGAAQLASIPISGAAGRLRGRGSSSSASNGGSATPSADDPGGPSGGGPTTPSSNGPQSPAPSSGSAAKPSSAAGAGTDSGAPEAGRSGASSGTPQPTRADASPSSSSAATQTPSTGTTPPGPSAAVTSGPNPDTPTSSTEAGADTATASGSGRAAPVVRVISRPPILTPAQRATVARDLAEPTSDAAKPRRNPTRSETPTAPPAASATPAQGGTSTPLAKSRRIARPGTKAAAKDKP